MRLPHRSGFRATWILTLAGWTFWAMSSLIAGPAAGARSEGRDPAQTMPAGGAVQPHDSEIKQLQGQIKSLRDELHSQLDPLQSQIRALHEKYDPQIQGLEDQKKTLVEQGKPAAIQQLDRQEDAELAALVEREKTEVEKVHQQTATERKEIQEKYDARRKEARL